MYSQKAWCPHCHKETDHGAIVGVIRDGEIKHRYYGFDCSECGRTNYLGTPWLTPETWMPIKWIDCPKCGCVTPHSDEYVYVSPEEQIGPVNKYEPSYYAHIVQCMLCGNAPSNTEESERDGTIDVDTPFKGQP